MTSINNPNKSQAGTDIPDLSRVAFFDQQRLAAADLNGAGTVQRELRWLHNRSLHTWGIGLGFAVTGKKGDTQVGIGPGYAIDCLGREIILTDSLTRPVPARADNGSGEAVSFYLVAAYPDDSKAEVVERRAGECGTDGAVRLRERADIYWKAAGEGGIETGIEIVLAQVSVKDCKLSAAVSVEQRRNARPNQQPYVAGGSASASNAEWQLWTTVKFGSPPDFILQAEEIGSHGFDTALFAAVIAGHSWTAEAEAETGGVRPPEEKIILGVQMRVDTSEARFSSIPQYQAQVVGERIVFVIKPGKGEEKFRLDTYIVDGTAYLREVDRTGFTLYVHVPRGLRTLSDAVPVNPPRLFANGGAPLLDHVRAKWSVAWLGVEG